MKLNIKKSWSLNSLNKVCTKFKVNVVYSSVLINV